MNQVPRPRVSPEFMRELEKGLAEYKCKKGRFEITMPEYTREIIRKKKNEKKDTFDFNI
jgi:hypothetical protein